MILCLTSFTSPPSLTSTSTSSDLTRLHHGIASTSSELLLHLTIMVRHDPDRLYPNPNGPNLPQVPGSWLFDNGNARDRKSGELEGIHPDTRYLFDLLNSAKRENKKNQKFWREIYHPHYKKWKELDTYLKKKTFEEKVKYGIL